MQTRNIAIMVIVLVALAAAWALASDGTVDQKGVLSGRVLANGLAQPGAVVHEGDVLVFVEGIAGPTPAVRANIDGTVKEVLVKPGDVVKSGEVLVKIKPAR